MSSKSSIVPILNSSKRNFHCGSRMLSMLSVQTRTRTRSSRFTKPLCPILHHFPHTRDSIWGLPGARVHILGVRGQASFPRRCIYNSTYSSLEIPAEGWPEKIQTCLTSVGRPVDSSSVIDLVHMTPIRPWIKTVVWLMRLSTSPPLMTIKGLNFRTAKRKILTILSPITEISTLVKSGTVGHLGPAVFTPLRAPSCTKLTTGLGEESSVILVFKPIDPSSTPRVINHKFTLPRPEKNAADSSTILSLLSSSLVTPFPVSSRGITTPRASPNKRHKLVDDKENISSHHDIPSFTERFAIRSPAWVAEESVLGKRWAIDNW